MEYSRTFEFGFWVPYTANIDRNTVSVIKVKTPGRDVKNKQFSIRGFDVPEMQGCGRASFPSANSSLQDKMTWASNSTSTSWAWNRQYDYNADLQTSCAADDMIWFYNLHVIASEAEITNKVALTFEFYIEGFVHVATAQQSLHEVQVNLDGEFVGTRTVNQIYDIGEFPEIVCCDCGICFPLTRRQLLGSLHT